LQHKRHHVAKLRAQRHANSYFTSPL
jgi:hypothetical protein